MPERTASPRRKAAAREWMRRYRERQRQAEARRSRAWIGFRVDERSGLLPHELDALRAAGVLERAA
jgi:hypothetical protein